MAFYSITLSFASFLFASATHSGRSFPRAFRDLFRGETFGAVDPEVMVEIKLPTAGAGGLISAVIVVNIPQLVLSFSYVLYNSLLTSMHLYYEYSTYASRRRPLRVSRPKGTQRATYWLQLPYTYGITLITASVTLHWLVSQSIFLSRVKDFVDEEGYGGEFPQTGSQPTESNIGYSAGPIFTIIMLAICMILTVIGLSFRKLKSRMPLAVSCSFALAAATHRTDEDIDASVLPVMLGEVPRVGSEVVGHCCFTSEDVVDLVEGRKYAGVHKRAHG